MSISTQVFGFSNVNDLIDFDRRPCLVLPLLILYINTHNKLTVLHSMHLQETMMWCNQVLPKKFYHLSAIYILYSTIWQNQLKPYKSFKVVDGLFFFLPDLL